MSLGKMIRIHENLIKVNRKEVCKSHRYYIRNWFQMECAAGHV